MTTAITFVALGTSLPDTFASKTAAEQDPYADASIGNVTGSNSVNVFLGLGIPWGIAAIYWSGSFEHAAKAEWALKYACRGDIGLEIVREVEKAGGEALKFVAIAGGLSANVAVFAINALLCIGFLAVRRRVHGGELGGPKKSLYFGQYISAAFCVSLWIIYLVVSIVLELQLKKNE